MNKYYILSLSALLMGSLAIAQERVSLVETFTSSTCPPCNPGNVALEALLANSVNDNKFVSVKYQVNWPGNGDPYYTEEAGTRKNIYSVNGVPVTEIDADYDGNPSNMVQGDLDNAYAIAPLADISAYYQIHEATQTVDVQIDYEALAELPPSTRVFAVIFEYETFNNVGGNGETQFEHVMKKMMTGPTGMFIGPQSIGDTGHEDLTYTFQGNYILPPDALTPHDETIEHTVEEFSDLGVAVWLQSTITKEIYQSAYAKIGYDPLSVEENEAFVSAKVYPNPTYDNSTVVFNLTESQDVSVEIVNTLGQVVESVELKNVEAGRVEYTMNTSSLAEGMYTVSIQSATGSISTRLSIQ